MRHLIIAMLAARVLAAQDPVIFAPGIISGGSNELSPAFAPDCKSVWYTVDNGTEYAIVTSHIEHGHWTVPTVAEFSGYWRDLEATMAPDGSYLIFASNRPATAGGAPLDGNYGGSVRPGRGGNLWRVDRRGSGWSTPVRLPETVNANSSVFSPSIAGNGNLYFMKPDSTGSFQLYRSAYENGQYQPAARLPFSDSPYSSVDPAVAPDESFVVYSSDRPPTAKNDDDLFIVFQHNGTWDTPVSLGPRVNSPTSEIEARLSPDSRTVYFTSKRVAPWTPGTPVVIDRMRVWNNGLQHIWRADLSPWIGNYSSGHCTPAP